MRTSLQVRLTLYFLIIILITVGILAVATNFIISNRFNEMVFNTGQRLATRIEPFFADYFEQNGSWDNVSDNATEHLYYLTTPPFSQGFGQGDGEGQGQGQGQGWGANVAPTEDVGTTQETNTPVDNPSDNNPPEENPPEESPPEDNDIFPWLFPDPGTEPKGLGPSEERVLLIDVNGSIVFDSNPDGDTLPSILDNLDKGVDIFVNEEKVGTILVASSLGILTSIQRTFLTQVNIFLIIVAVVSAAIAVAVGWFQAKRIVAPVKAIAGAAQQVASGDYTQRVPVESKDELGEMATAFNTMAEELEEQRVLRQRAMSDIAHELRTPLSVMQIDIESIEDGINEPNNENIGLLREQVIYISRLVNDLRMLALADAGELQFDMGLLDIAGLIKIIANRIENTFKDRKLTLSIDIPETNLMVNGDEQRLSQVLLNLLNNASQHTPEGGCISIRCVRIGDEIHTVIKDNGEGIPEMDLPYVFDRLYRASDSRSRKTGGTGLGLSIARSLVEAHGGRIWIQSVEGKGTTITFALPCIDPNVI